MTGLVIFVIYLSVGFAKGTVRNNTNTENRPTLLEAIIARHHKEAISNMSEHMLMAKEDNRKCKAGQYVCGDGHCCCDHHSTAICNDSLTYVPKLPSEILHLIFSFNKIHKWNKNTFENVSNIETLFLQNNGLRRCDNDTFINLKLLKNFSISDENVTKEVIQNCLESVSSRKMDSISLLSNHIYGSGLGEIFRAMNDSSVSQIYMNHTDMHVFVQSDFKRLENIQILSFFSCWLTLVDLNHALPKVTELIFSSNSISQFPKFCDGEKAMFPNLAILRLDANIIRNLPAAGFHCMKKLRKISLAQNPLLAVQPNTFSKLPNLQEIVMNYVYHQTPFRKFILYPYAFNSSSLNRLYLKGSNLPIYLTEISPKTFQSCPNLQILYFADNPLYTFTDDQFDELLSGMENLKELSLTNTGINLLPGVISRTMKKLETLYLDHNDITGWPDGYFDPLVTLTRLNLRFNKISTLSKSSLPWTRAKNFFFIDLSNNPYSCTCSELLEFINLIKSKTLASKLKYFPRKYKCSSPSEFVGERITETPISDKHCILNSHVSLLIITVCILAVSIIFFVSLVYRYRWHIRYRLYMMKHYYTGYKRLTQLIQDGYEYKYDVYLSCSENDLGFVVDTLMPHLEQTMGLCVFLPSRDGLGQTNVECAANIDFSKRVLICVSNAYSIGNYCAFETDMACDSVLQERCKMVVVILLEEVRICRSTKTLHRIMKVDDYIKWDDTQRSIDMFWEKLTSRLTDGS